MKIATWNVNSITIRLDQVLSWLKTTNTDVLCLQETKCVDEKFPLEEINNAGFYAAFMGQKSYNGVAILSRYELKDVQYNLAGDNADAPKRLIAATVENIRIVNTYISTRNDCSKRKRTRAAQPNDRVIRAGNRDLSKTPDLFRK
jgi:exodeoxyribonuclease-3